MVGQDVLLGRRRKEPLPPEGWLHFMLVMLAMTSAMFGDLCGRLSGSLRDQRGRRSFLAATGRVPMRVSGPYPRRPPLVNETWRSSDVKDAILSPCKAGKAEPAASYRLQGIVFLGPGSVVVLPMAASFRFRG
jgi:hypothetical protein